MKTANSEIQEAFRFFGLHAEIQLFQQGRVQPRKKYSLRSAGERLKCHRRLRRSAGVFLENRDGARVGGVRGQISHGQQCVRRSIQITVSGA